MADPTTPLVRLYGPEELPVRIPDWPEQVGIAVCRVGGKTIAFQPYHQAETGPALRKRLPQEAGAALQGFAAYPALRGLSEARIGYAEDQRLTAELENALRSMPRLVEAVQDFAINFEFAAEEGLGLDGLNDTARRRAEPGPSAPVSDQMPVGYHPFKEPDRSAEVIAGAMLRPVGAAGIDLLLSAEARDNPRALPPEVNVLVRDDSLRVAIPLAGVLVNDKLPAALRLPAGALVLGQSGGKPVPAQVLRRGNYLFVAPDVGAIASPAAVQMKAARGPGLPWGLIALVLGLVLLAAAIGAAAFAFWPSGTATSGPLAPVDSLRSGLFSTPSN